jgi:hypothetical protein
VAPDEREGHGPGVPGGTGYLRAVLADGARPFRHRARIRALLGAPDETGVRVAFALAPVTTDFGYLRAPYGATGTYPPAYPPDAGAPVPPPPPPPVSAELFLPGGVVADRPAPGETGGDGSDGPPAAAGGQLAAEETVFVPGPTGRAAAGSRAAGSGRSVDAQSDDDGPRPPAPASPAIGPLPWPPRVTPAPGPAPAAPRPDVPPQDDAHESGTPTPPRLRSALPPQSPPRPAAGRPLRAPAAPAGPPGPAVPGGPPGPPEPPGAPRPAPAPQTQGPEALWPPPTSAVTPRAVPPPRRPTLPDVQSRASITPPHPAAASPRDVPRPRPPVHPTTPAREAAPTTATPTAHTRQPRPRSAGPAAGFGPVTEYVREAPEPSPPTPPAPPVQAPVPVLVVQDPAAAGTPAFWERRHLGRLRGGIRR